MTARDLKAELGRLVKSVVAPLMKAHGFERRGQSFRRRHGEVLQYISLEANRYNDAEHVSFTGNLSFLRDLPRVAEDFWCDDPEAWLGGVRLGQLTHGRDHWYRLEDSAFAELATRIEEVLRGQVLPLLDSVTNVAEAQACLVRHAPGGS